MRPVKRRKKRRSNLFLFWTLFVADIDLFPLFIFLDLSSTVMPCFFTSPILCYWFILFDLLIHRLHFYLFVQQHLVVLGPFLVMVDYIFPWACHVLE